MAIQKTEKIIIRIDEDVKKKYLEFCNKKGFNLSKRIRIFIDMELDGKNI
jgi:antitoxin component of RelBE/YafQ-DinJ toxin-antitoxin module